MKRALLALMLLCAGCGTKSSVNEKMAVEPQGKVRLGRVKVIVTPNMHMPQFTPQQLETFMRFFKDTHYITNLVVTLEK